MTRRLALTPALAAAVGFLPRAWAGGWAVLLLSAAVLALPAFVHGLGHAAWFWAAHLYLLAAAAVGLSLQGALYRLGVSADLAEARRHGLGLGGLQFGRPELRLLGAGILVALFLALVAAGLGLAFVFVITVLGIRDIAELSPPAAIAAALRGEGWAILVCALAALAVWTLVQLGVRLSLFRAATVARGRMTSLDAMALAQGSFWSLFAGLVVVMLPTLALMAWSGGLFGPPPAAVLHLPMLSGSKAYALIRAAVLAFVQAPLGIGFLSWAYKRLEYGSGR